MKPRNCRLVLAAEAHAAIDKVEADGIAEVERRFAALKAGSPQSEHTALEIRRLNEVAGIIEDANRTRRKITEGKSYKIHDLQ